jgi:hypothetical protein
MRASIHIHSFIRQRDYSFLFAGPVTGCASADATTTGIHSVLATPSIVWLGHHSSIRQQLDNKMFGFLLAPLTDRVTAWRDPGEPNDCDSKTGRRTRELSQRRQSNRFGNSHDQTAHLSGAKPRRRTISQATSCHDSDI